MAESKMKEPCLFRVDPSDSNPKGSIVVRVRLRGTPKREKTFSIADYKDSVNECKKAAVAWREATRESLENERKFTGGLKRADPTSSFTYIKTFKNILELYKKTPIKKGKNQGKERTFHKEMSRYERLMDELGKYQPWEIPAKLKERVDYWLDTLELEPSTVNRHITMAKSAMEAAYNTKVGAGEIRKRLIPENYLDDFQLFKEQNIRYRILSEIEREKLWNELPMPLKALYFHALNSPVRKSDLINIRLENCNQISGCIELPSTKNGNIRTLVMPDWLQQWRNNLPASATHLHCNTDGTPLGYYSDRDGKYIMMSHWEEKFRDACERAGINHSNNIEEVKYTFHKTRQESVLLLYQAGHSKDEIMDIGDWESEDAFKRYFDKELAIKIKAGKYRINDIFTNKFTEELLRKVA